MQSFGIKNRIIGYQETKAFLIIKVEFNLLITLEERLNIWKNIKNSELK